ncbi:hypothetical protein ACOME3_007730 [Neoechinorhynchus agilis]
MLTRSTSNNDRFLTKSDTNHQQVYRTSVILLPGRNSHSSNNYDHRPLKTTTMGPTTISQPVDYSRPLLRSLPVAQRPTMAYHHRRIPKDVLKRSQSMDALLQRQCSLSKVEKPRKYSPPPLSSSFPVDSASSLDPLNKTYSRSTLRIPIHLRPPCTLATSSTNSGPASGEYDSDDSVCGIPKPAFSRFVRFRCQ